MFSKTIINPQTNRQNKVNCWNINPREVLRLMREGKIKTARDLSWMLLNDDDTIQLMEETDAGDCQNNNFALNVFENALDWGLGIKVLGFIRAFTQVKKMPKPFVVAANRKGDVFIITQSGQIL